MKKSLRILSLILSVVMIMGSMSLIANAYTMNNGRATYRTQDGTGGLVFDDTNDPVYDVHQYATMALDEIDRMLLAANLGTLDIYIGTLELESVDGAIASVRSLYNSVSSLLNVGVLGDASLLDISAIQTTARGNGDITVLWDALNLIGDLNPILRLYVNGTINLGAVQPIIKDYVFNVRELVIGLLYGLTDMEEDYDYMESRTIPAKYQGANTGLIFLQDVLNTLVIGEWKKLDDLFYNENNKSSNVVFSEYEFHIGSASGAIATETTPNTTSYDYYGFVHPDRWVTFGLGDAIRVANNAAAPEPSFTKVDFRTNTPVYDFVEPVLLHAYNNILVPVLNRITKNWIREKAGYVFDEKYTTLYKKDLPEWRNSDFTVGSTAYNACFDQNGEPVINPDYDYLYPGVKPTETEGEEGSETTEAIFKIFDEQNFKFPKYILTSGHLFIDDLNRNVINVARKCLKATVTLNGNAVTDANYNPTDGQIYTFTWTDPDDSSHTESFNATYGSNNLLLNNVCNALKFVINVTGEEFFSDVLINKGQVKNRTQVNALTNQQLLAYVIRSVINANVDYMWIPENENTQTIIGAAFEAVVQLAYQDLPGFTYTRPANPTVENMVTKGLAILMDIAAYKLNNNMDTVPQTNGTGSRITNNGSTNNTGMLPILGDSGSYATNVLKIAAWAISKWVNTSYTGTTTNPGGTAYNEVLNIPAVNFAKYNNGGSTLTEDAVWSDLDYVINSILPIKYVAGASQDHPDNRPWLHNDISNPASGLVIKSFIFDTVVYPIVENLDAEPLLKLLQRNTAGAFAYDSIQVIVVDTVHRIFDLLFPNVFDNTVNTLDGFINNSALAGMVSDLAITLSSTRSSAYYSNYQTVNGSTIYGKGKVIAEFALPIVCMILGLSDTQEFGQLENYIPDVLPSSPNSADFYIANASSGVNTSYIDEDGNRQVDKLYTYKITAHSVSVIAGPSGNVTYTGIVDNSTTLTAGESIPCTISGFSDGQILQIITRYKVFDETGAALGTELQNTAYTLISTSAEADDERLASTSLSGSDVLQAPTDVFISGGLSSLNNFTFRIKDDKAASNLTVNSVTISSAPGNPSGFFKNTQWLSKSTDPDDINVSMNGKEATYVISPFVVDEKAGRSERIYEEDKDGNLVLDECDMPTWTGSYKAPESGNYYVSEGEYTITTSFGGSKNVTVQTKVHIFNNFNLPSLLGNAIAANRSSLTLDSTGQGMWSTYSTALINAISLDRQYSRKGATFTAFTSASGYENKFEKCYRELYTQIEAIKEHELNAGAAALFSAVNSTWGYDFTRASGTYTDGKTSITAYYRDYKEYYENGYPYKRPANYVGVTYDVFKDAVNRANSLIDREYKYIGYTPEDFEKLKTAEKTAAIEAYQKAVADVGSISSVDSAIAIHMLNLQSSRLISLGVGSRTKLVSAYSLYGTITEKGTYSGASWKAYTNAKTFANSVKGNSSATPEMIKRAMNELIKAWKHLEIGADYDAAKNTLSTMKAFLHDECNSWGLTGGQLNGAIKVDDAAQQTIYTVDSFSAFLEALRALEIIVATEGTDDELGAGDQDRIDSAVEEVNKAKAALVDYSSGGTELVVEANPDYAGYSYMYLYKNHATIYPNDFENGGLLTDVGYDTVRMEGDFMDVPLDGAIFGIEEGFTDETFLLYDPAPITIQNAYAEVTMSPAGRYGTGSFLVIKEAADGPIEQLYLIVLRGDANGDGEITSTDKAYMSNYINSVEGFQYDWSMGEDDYILLALDLDGSGWADTIDVPFYSPIVSGVSDLKQDVGGLYDGEFME